MALPAWSRPQVHRTLVLPALDEVDAVPGLAALAREAADVVDRVVVLDGGSTDGTPAAARAAGLEVIDAASRPPGRPVLGKGDSAWRIADLDTDVLVFRDADVRGVGPTDIDALATAVERSGVALAKGRFTRLQFADGPPRPVSGRITTFVAEPLLALVVPAVAHLPEPLSGQFAIRREVLERLPVVTRYGLDVGLVLGVAATCGTDAIASVDVGSLTHRSKSDASLVPMAHDVAATILGRGDAVAGVPAGVPDDTDDAVLRRLACAGPDGPLVVRPPRRDFTDRAEQP